MNYKIAEDFTFDLTAKSCNRCSLACRLKSKKFHVAHCVLLHAQEAMVYVMLH